MSQPDVLIRLAHNPLFMDDRPKPSAGYLCGHRFSTTCVAMIYLDNGRAPPDAVCGMSHGCDQLRCLKGRPKRQQLHRMNKSLMVCSHGVPQPTPPIAKALKG